MTLPLLLSVPHAGLAVPPEAAPYCSLTPREIADDGDEGAAEIYLDLEQHVAAFHATDIARAFIDMNRSEDDRRCDGVIKTHTCWGVPVYPAPLPDEAVERLIARYHRPYHRRLTELAARRPVRLAVDCHTMAAQGPPVGPDAGRDRPWICLGYGDGTCPKAWIDELKMLFEARIGPHVTVNEPFGGGYITRCHSTEMPWLQLEISRAPFLLNSEKRDAVLMALTSLSERI